MNVCILKRTIRLLENIYDEVRVCRTQLISKMLFSFENDTIITELQVVLQKKIDLEKEKEEAA